VEKRSSLRSAARLAVVAGALTLCPSLGVEAQVVPPAYIEPGYQPRYYLGDEDTQRGWAHFIRGNYGLAQKHYRRAVEATHQNSSAWIGLAASYDRLGRFDLADRAYRNALRLDGESYVILNNMGYSYLLRGNARKARRLLERAHYLAPGDPTIINNIATLDSGQAYFHGYGP
jgi:Flp pilus assembly protein TadD